MSTMNRQFSLALDALAELKTETESPLRSQSIPVTPTLGKVLAEVGPLPREALFLGVASDGLPVLLNLHDPVPGPMLIAGDSGSGKTAFLQMVAGAVTQTHESKDVQFGVITNRPDEWERFQESPHRVGIFSAHHTSAQEFLLSLASWAHANKNTRQSVLLFMDDLEAAARMDFEALQNLRWLLLRGPSRRVWTLVTLDAERYGQVISWIPNFRTRLFGQIMDERVAGALAGDKASAFDKLEAPTQFSLRESGNWLRFWVPSC